MEAKLYVGNMPYDTSEDQLREMFSQAEAEKAISLFNEKSINDRALTVNIARPREERSNRGGGGYGRRY